MIGYYLYLNGEIMSVFNEIFYHNDTEANAEFNVCFAGITMPDENYAITRDASPSIIIEYITDGIGYLEIGGKCYTLSAGNSVIIPHHTEHKYYSDKSRPYTKKWLNIKGALAEKILEFTLRGMTPIISSANIDNDISLIIKMISEGSDNNTLMLAVFTKILHNVAEKIIDKPTITKEKNSTTTAERIERYIINHLQDKFSLQSICDVFYLSDSHIVRLFKETYGITPYRYYLNQKTELAKSLLINTELSIDSICTKLNYSDRNHFFVAFKQVTGMSPYRYRRNYIEEHNTELIELSESETIDFNMLNIENIDD